MMHHDGSRAPQGGSRRLRRARHLHRLPRGHRRGEREHTPVTPSIFDHPGWRSPGHVGPPGRGGAPKTSPRLGEG
jgi:hypothetical protein